MSRKIFLLKEKIMASREVKRTKDFPSILFCLLHLQCIAEGKKKRCCCWYCCVAANKKNGFFAECTYIALHNMQWFTLLLYNCRWEEEAKKI